MSDELQIAVGIGTSKDPDLQFLHALNELTAHFVHKGAHPKLCLQWVMDKQQLEIGKYLEGSEAPKLAGSLAYCHRCLTDDCRHTQGEE